MNDSQFNEILSRLNRIEKQLAGLNLTTGNLFDPETEESEGKITRTYYTDGSVRTSYIARELGVNHCDITKVVDELEIPYYRDSSGNRRYLPNAQKLIKAIFKSNN